MNAADPDYIIIGAGSAGAVLANRLSLHNRVLLLEAGPTDLYWDYRLHMPAALSHVLKKNRYNWYYHSEPEPGLNHRRMYCPRGKVLGGSSSINGMIFVRGNRHDYDRWADVYGLADWRYEQCLPYFLRSETRPHGEAGFRGEDGPMQVSRGALDNPLFHAWLAAGEQAGFVHRQDMNGVNQEGVGAFDMTIHRGRRFSTARAYLAPINNRDNLTILTGARVERIRLEGQRAVGLQYRHHGKTLQATAQAEIILCGGAINSPHLLQLSGIGDTGLLNEAGLECRHPLSGVGRNLQDHLEIYVQYACRQPVSLAPYLRWYRQPFVGLQWYLNQTGPGASNHFETGGFLKSSIEQAYPDLQFHFLPIAMNYDGSEKVTQHGFQLHVGPMKPTSRGSVQAIAADPATAPRIAFNYHTTEADRTTMIRGIRLARSLLAQPAFDTLRGEELQPGGDATSDDEIETFIRSRAESAYHPCGTCRMGYDDDAVVDTTGRVRGLEGLRVVDASIMPEIPNGNLNAPVIMMAEKIAARMLE